jgi:hypothetical protein
LGNAVHVGVATALAARLLGQDVRIPIEVTSGSNAPEDLATIASVG